MTGQEPRTSAVPPPPRGKKAGQSPNTRHRNNAESDDDSVDGGAEVPTGAGYNAARSARGGEDNDSPAVTVASPPRRRKDILNDTPETTIGHQVSMTGELVFDKLLRIDGKFNGKLISKGDLIVGPTGVLTGNVLDMGEIIVDGTIVGDIVVQKVTLRGHASVQGAITCKSLSMDPHVVVVGALNVHPAAPEKFAAPTAAADKGESPVKSDAPKKNSTAGKPAAAAPAAAAKQSIPAVVDEPVVTAAAPTSEAA